MSQSTNGGGDREGTSANRMVDLREAARKGVETIDLGDVAPTKPTNLNPFETTKPIEPPAQTSPPDASASEDTESD